MSYFFDQSFEKPINCPAADLLAALTPQGIEVLHRDSVGDRTHLKASIAMTVQNIRLWA